MALLSRSDSSLPCAAGVSKGHQIQQMILRFHQRRAGHHDETREVGRVEATEPFSNVCWRASGPTSLIA